jgi:GR25 family glycosyltransferase involved in LPS biosynthesis
MFNKENVNVISIKNSFRRNNITDELQKNNLDFTFFDAITPVDFKLNKINDNIEIYLNDSKYFMDQNSIKNNLNRDYMREGEIGCALSHIKICEKLLNDPFNDFYLVLEDDTICKFNSDELNILESYLKNNLYKQDLIYLLNFSPSFKNGKLWNFDVCKKISDNFYLLNDNFSTLLEATNAFIINKNYCKKFLDLIKNNGIFNTADGAIITMYALKTINVTISDINYFSPIFVNNNTYVHESKPIMI